MVESAPSPAAWNLPDFHTGDPEQHIKATKAIQELRIPPEDINVNIEDIQANYLLWQVDTAPVAGMSTFYPDDAPIAGESTFYPDTVPITGFYPDIAPSSI